MSAFENFGPPQAAPADRMECGVCWLVYDPAEGDPVAQVAPGTPFADLTEDWRCPNCDAPRERFLRLET
jgi:rubredoxin